MESPPSHPLRAVRRRVNETLRRVGYEGPDGELRREVLSWLFPFSSAERQELEISTNPVFAWFVEPRVEGEGRIEPQLRQALAKDLLELPALLSEELEMDLPRLREIAGIN